MTDTANELVKDLYTAKRTLTEIEKLRSTKMAALGEIFSDLPAETKRLHGESGSTVVNYNYEVIPVSGDQFIGVHQSQSRVSDAYKTEVEQAFGSLVVYDDVPVTLAELRDAGMAKYLFEDETSLEVDTVSISFSMKKVAKESVVEDVLKTLNSVAEKSTLVEQLHQLKLKRDECTEKLKDVNVTQLRTDDPIGFETYVKKAEKSEALASFTDLSAKMLETLPFPKTSLIRQKINLFETFQNVEAEGEIIPESLQRATQLSLIGAGTLEEIEKKAQKIANGSAYDIEQNKVLLDKLITRSSDAKKNKTQSL